MPKKQTVKDKMSVLCQQSNAAFQLVETLAEPVDDPPGDDPCLEHRQLKRATEIVLSTAVIADEIAREALEACESSAEV